MKKLILTSIISILLASVATRALTPVKKDFSHESLELWAEAVVTSYWPDDKSGVYDICYSNARKGQEILDMDTNIPYAVQDACAIIMHGAEW